MNRLLLKYDVVEDLGALSGDLELREHLLEHHDYEVVSRKVFSVLARWYGCDFEIARGMKEDPFKKNKFYLDLYPGNFFVHKIFLFPHFSSISIFFLRLNFF